MTISITDDLVTVDISESDTQKTRIARIAVMNTVGAQADTVQHFGSTGFGLSITGTWYIAAGVNDGRVQIETWRRNNTLVRFTDGSAQGWYTIVKFTSKLIQGQPTSIIVYYDLELHEAIALQTDETGGTQYSTESLPSEGAWTSWAKQWDVVVPGGQIAFADIYIDEVNGVVTLSGQSKVAVLKLVDGSTVLADAGRSDGGTVGPLYTPYFSVQRTFILLSSPTKTFTVLKAGGTIDAPDNLSPAPVIGGISLSGQYILVGYLPSGVAHAVLYKGS